MIISRTPLRISFVGGGSDIAGYYRHSPGAVVSTAVNKYIYIMVEKQFDGRIIVQYSKIEIVKRVVDIENNLVREAMKMTGIKGGIHVTSISDVPAEGTGMGSSSAYVVGLLNALYAYQGKYVSAQQLARQACKIEIDILQKPIGKQDQYIAAYGGFQFIQFNPDGSVGVDSVISSEKTKQKLQERLLLLYTGITRSSDVILAKQKANICRDAGKRNMMGRIVTLAEEMRECLHRNQLNDFGELLDENWEIKRTMAEGISSPQIDEWYAIAKRKGALGGKLLGAGGGGFLLLYAPKSHHRQIVEALPKLQRVNVGFEPQGSKIIFVGE